MYLILGNVKPMHIKVCVSDAESSNSANETIPNFHLELFIFPCEISAICARRNWRSLPNLQAYTPTIITCIIGNLELLEEWVSLLSLGYITERVRGFAYLVPSTISDNSKPSRKKYYLPRSY